MKNLIRRILKVYGYKVTKNIRHYANPDLLEKAPNFLERYREIVSDPINIFIKRVPEAGYVDENGLVILHNGNRVPVDGTLAYYSNFSDILVINRGVHEPLEEFCFQQVLEKIKIESPIMIELGAYWAHYSMWLMRDFSKAKCYMVEPDLDNIACGKNNLKINKFQGDFINDIVSSSRFQLDIFVAERKLKSINILHSDIQGYELEMIDGAKNSLQKNIIDYVFISTHSQDLHTSVINKLNTFGYRVEVASDYDNHTTSCDGFILASSPRVSPVFKSFSPLGRLEIARATPKILISYLLSSTTQSA
jgi:hypothetical protein